MKHYLKNILLTLLVALLLYYFMLPPINLTAMSFYVYLLLAAIFGLIIFMPKIIIGSLKTKYNNRIILNDFPRFLKIVILTISCVFILIVLVNIICSPIFNSNKYANRIKVLKDTTFTEDIKSVDFNKIPLLDKDSSMKLGDRKMGSEPEWVSQFYVSNLYTQINYNDSIVRVTPIEYAGFIKYLTNRKDGIKGYIKVNSVNGESSLVKLNKGIKYTESAYFFENVYRKLRLSYPFTIFDDISFEIDNDGNPYFIAPTVKYVGVGLRKEINGVVILDAITGKSEKYDIDNVPTWVDHVYSSSLIIEQLDDWGNYNDGFINSIIGQKNVVNTTDGYNYLVMDDDVYLYTGITSVSSDESNLGFVLVNMRTKETHYYEAPGAEEYSAMASAEGLVQEKGYIASFPLLINLNSKPTYLLSLKDNAGLVKMYAFVDVEDYQKVIVSDVSLGIEYAANKYLGDDIINHDNDTKESMSITIKTITNAVIDGNTYYYIIDNNDNLYTCSIKVNRNKLPILKNGDNLDITYIKNNVNEIIEIK